MSKTKSRKSRNSAAATPDHETPSTQCDDVSRHRDVYEPIIGKQWITVCGFI